MVRPTQSDGLYCQCVGRVLRPYPGKDSALILDYKPVEDRNIVMAGDVLGKPKAAKKAEAIAIKQMVLVDGISRAMPMTGIDGDPDRIVLRELHLLGESSYKWFYDAGVSTLGLGDKKDRYEVSWKGMLAILPVAGSYRLVKIAVAKGQTPQIQVVLKTADFGEAQGQGQYLAQRLGAPAICSRDREWNALRATVPQINYLSTLRRDIPRSKLLTLTRGEVSQLITHAIALNALRQAGFEWEERAG